MSLATRIAEEFNTLRSESTVTPIPLSTQLKGTFSLSNTVKTLSFDAITYTGNGTSQEIVTGLSTIDFTQANNGTGFYHDRLSGDCIVRNDAGTAIESGSIAFKDVAGVDGVCQVHIKGRSIVSNNFVIDGIRGAYRLQTNTTAIEDDYSTVIGYTSNGLLMKISDINVNQSGATYIAYVTLYTHIKWGLTNQGKRYIEAYNPVTNDTMIMYQGSGVSGHEIPHSVGVELDFWSMKNLDGTDAWTSKRQTSTSDKILLLNDTLAEYSFSSRANISTTNSISLEGVSTAINGSNNSYILYGKAKSKTWTIVQYTGTGVAGNFVETKDVDGIARRPARVIVKAVSTTGGWYVFDYARVEDANISLNTSAIEAGGNYLDIKANGIDLRTSATEVNASGVQYIALVEFDTDGTGSSGAYFDNPTDTTQLQLTDGLVSISNGYNVNGADNKVVSKSGTIVPTGGYV